jgi:hypothetical protein
VHKPEQKKVKSKLSLQTKKLKKPLLFRRFRRCKECCTVLFLEEKVGRGVRGRGVRETHNSEFQPVNLPLSEDRMVANHLYGITVLETIN